MFSDLRIEMATRNGKKNNKKNKTSSSPVNYGNAAKNFKQGVGSPNANTKDQPSDQAQPLALATPRLDNSTTKSRSPQKTARMAAFKLRSR